MLMAGAGVVAGPGGFGSGWRSGEVLAAAIVGGRRKIAGWSAVASEAASGVIFGGRRIAATGVRVGRTMRAVSRFSMPGAEPPCSGLRGSAIRTVSFFGSAMEGGPTKLHKDKGTVTCLFGARP